MVENEIKKIKDAVKEYITVDYLKQLFTFIDLTSLNTDDEGNYFYK